MTYKTHLAFAYAINIPIIQNLYEREIFDTTSTIIALALTFIFALAPDLDHPKSFLSNIPIFNIISWVISTFSNHRGVTHKFYSAFIPPLLIFGLFSYLNIYQGIGIKGVDFLSFIAFMAYLSHLLGDCTTKSGIRGFFKPLTKKTIYVVPKFMRYKTGTSIEGLYFIFFVFLMGFELSGSLFK